MGRDTSGSCQHFGLSLSGSLYVSVVGAVCASLGVGLMLPTLLAWAMGILLTVYRGRGTGLWTDSFLTPPANFGNSCAPGAIPGGLKNNLPLLQLRCLR